MRLGTSPVTCTRRCPVTSTFVAFCRSGARQVGDPRWCRSDLPCSAAGTTAHRSRPRPRATTFGQRSQPGTGRRVRHSRATWTRTVPPTASRFGSIRRVPPGAVTCWSLRSREGRPSVATLPPLAWPGTDPKLLMLVELNGRAGRRAGDRDGVCCRCLRARSGLHLEPGRAAAGAAPTSTDAGPVPVLRRVSRWSGLHRTTWSDRGHAQSDRRRRRPALGGHPLLLPCSGDSVRLRPQRASACRSRSRGQAALARSPWRSLCELQPRLAGDDLEGRVRLDPRTAAAILPPRVLGLEVAELDMDAR